MKIALIGYGKMGRLVEQTADAKGHQIVARFSRELGTPQERWQDLVKTDLVIDFSQAPLVIDHLKLCLSLNKPLVIGTTGWEEHQEKAQQMVEQANGSCLHAPNFSVGIYLFQRVVSYAASLFEPFHDYDASGVEYHHREKLDKPSGTAKALTENLLHHMRRLQNFEFSSIRCGHIPGTHTLHFDSAVDTVTLTHQARNREGFADGALMAAEWLFSRKGFFTIDDMMRDLCN